MTVDYQNGTNIRLWNATKQITYFRIPKVPGFIKINQNNSDKSTSLKYSANISLLKMSDYADYGNKEFRELLLNIIQINEFDKNGLHEILGLKPLTDLLNPNVVSQLVHYLFYLFYLYYNLYFFYYDSLRINIY